MAERESRKDRLGRLFTSDVFIFEEPGRVRRTLKFILGTVLAGAVSIAIYSLAIGWMETFRTAAGATAAFVAVTLMLRAGYPRLAGIVMMLSLLAAATYGVAQADGIHDVAIVVFPAVIIIGSLLLNARFFVVLTLMVIACAATVGILEVRGELATKFGGTFGYPDVFVLVIILAAEAVVIRLLASVITSSLMRAHRSERSYREIFNATSEAIFVHDAETLAILDVNRTTLSMFGCAREELLGESPDVLTADGYPLDDERKADLAGRAFREGTYTFEWLLQRKDKTRFWAEITLRSTEIGGQRRLLAVLRDVDARRRMEERLRHSEKLEAVGQLAGGVAHDFNNQLAGIVGYADLIRSELADGTELADSVDRILVAGRRAADLTAQLLAYARKGKYESAAVDLHQLIDEVAGLLSHSIDKRIELKQSLDAEPTTTLGDPTQLQSAILNLALNARDAMPDGGTLAIATRVVDIDGDDEKGLRGDIPPGQYVEVAVSDTGRGMDDKTQQRIFEPFFTTKVKGKGTGMGLAAVYGTVVNHGGTIAVYSEKGRGSTFRLLLPAYDGPVIPEDRVAGPRTEAVAGPARVLIVDDEESICRVASKMLEQMGYTTEFCLGGAAALERYRDSWRDIDLVLLDMSMPGMGGNETFAALRGVNPEAAVLLTSGFSLNEDVQALLDAGARGFIQKPFWKREFSSMVADALLASAVKKVPEDP